MLVHFCARSYRMSNVACHSSVWRFLGNRAYGSLILLLLLLAFGFVEQTMQSQFAEFLSLSLFLCVCLPIRMPTKNDEATATAIAIAIATTTPIITIAPTKCSEQFLFIYMFRRRIYSLSMLRPATNCLAKSINWPRFHRKHKIPNTYDHK